MTTQENIQSVGQVMKNPFSKNSTCTFVVNWIDAAIEPSPPTCDLCPCPECFFCILCLQWKWNTLNMFAESAISPVNQFLSITWVCSKRNGYNSFILLSKREDDSLVLSCLHAHECCQGIQMSMLLPQVILYNPFPEKAILNTIGDHKQSNILLHS